MYEECTIRVVVFRGSVIRTAIMSMVGLHLEELGDYIFGSLLYAIVVYFDYSDFLNMSGSVRALGWPMDLHLKRIGRHPRLGSS